MENIFFSYYWFLNEKEEEVTSIRIYGIDENNNNICVRVNDFYPYIYIELPTNISWNASRVQLVGNKIDQLLPKNKPLKKIFEMKYKLYGADLTSNGQRKKFPYLKCHFSHKDDIKKLGYIIKKSINILGIGYIKLKMHEQDADPILQLVSNRDIPTAGWIKFVGKEVFGDDKVTLCHKEYIVKSERLFRYDKTIVATPKIMGFDIEVNSTNPFAMPSAQKQGDKVFQISCVFAREGCSEEDYDIYILTLGEPDPKIVGENVTIYMYDTEYELLIGFTELIRTENPNVIVGYNILQFDIHYMIERAKYPCYCIGDFDKMGFHKYNHAKEKTIKWSSSAYKNQEFQFLDAEGRLFVDLLPLIRRDYKFNNYQLKTVSMNLLGDTKDDLSVRGIFKCYRIGTKKEADGTYSAKAKKAMGIVSKYCIKDSVLVVKLMEKTQTWVGLTEQASTYNTSIFSIYTQGQQIKVFSQVYKYCLNNNIIVEKDGYVAKEDERYVGAHVFPPEPGLYERVLPFDFASLYPSTIIAYNIDYSTIVFDESIPDSLCHVMEWSDHLNCLVEGSNITINGFGIDIKNLENNNNLILSHSEKSNLLEYKRQNNFFNKGKKECIEITFEDGTSLKCTPDHKIMTSDNIWIEAKNLKINESKIKKGITFPLTDFKEFISDFKLNCKDLTLNMTNIYEIEKFCKFSRLFGMLYTDGSLSKNRATIYTGDIVDAECVISDIYDVCGVKNNYKLVEKDNGKYFHITVPYEFHNSYIWKLGDGFGKRTIRDSILPSFILDKNCPIILKREFIAGMFGGDGLTITYSDKTKNYSTIGLCISKISDKIDNAKEFLNSIQNILIEDFDIKTYINGPYKKKDKDVYTLILYINVNDIIKFKDTIGFRYCTYKSFKLEVLCSYKNLINSVFNERENSFKIIKKLYETLTWDKAIEEGHKIIRQNEIIFNDHYAFPNKQAVMDSIRRPRDGNKKTFWSSKFPSFEKYLKELNVYNCFVDNKKNKSSSTYCMDQIVLNDIPYYELKVISVKSIGICNVYDIEIKDNHSFLANGIVVHNCSHDPKVIRKNELTNYIETQQAKLKELREKRDKKINKLCRQEIVDEINKITEEMKPYREERAQIAKTISKNTMCAERRYRFLKEPKGVIPTILQNLLDARANTRKIIKNNKKEILLLEDDKDKIKDLKLLNNVLDKRQLAYKISANSMYGAMGVKKGYLPFMPGAMCLHGDSLISYSYGFTRKMKNLKYTNSLWSYNDGQVISNGNGLIYNGKKEIVKITLNDGRILRCTPDHKIMTSKGWIEAGKLLPKHNWDGNNFSINNEYSNVIVGLELPEDIIGEDEKKWKLLDYTMDTYINREKTLAFCRILGFILSDGTISRYKNKYNITIISSSVDIGTLIDAKIFVSDIKLITDKEPLIGDYKGSDIKGNTYTVGIPSVLIKQIVKLDGVMIGKRSHQSYTLPEFLFDSKCPLSVIREFLGGLFGGDGTSPSLSVAHPSFSPIQFGWSTIEKYKDDMVNIMNKLIKLLSVFDIKFWLCTPKLARVREGLIPKDIEENPRWEYLITTNSSNTLLFAEKIGFRYCSDKNNKLTVASSYQRYSDNVRKQHINLILKTSEMYDLNNKKIGIKEMLIKTRKELYENEIPLHEHISISKSTDVNNHRSRSSSLKDYKLLQKYFPTAREYTRMVGCEQWFSENKCSKKVYSIKRTDVSSPCIHLDVLDVRYDGIDDVYDIIDVQDHSFLANGIVVHNCTTYMGRTNIEIVAKTIPEKYGGELVYGD